MVGSEIVDVIATENGVTGCERMCEHGFVMRMPRIQDLLEICGTVCAEWCVSECFVHEDEVSS